MLHNPWRRSPTGFTGNPLGKESLPGGVAQLVERKLGADWHDGFGSISAVFVGKRTVLKFDRFPNRTRRFDHDRAVTGMALPNAVTPQILDEGVTDGYEWIEQAVVPGRPAYEVWPGISKSSRVALMERLAECVAAMQEYSIDEKLLLSRFDSWREHVTAAALRAIQSATSVVPEDVLEQSRERIVEWGESLAETKHVTCHGDLWFGNVFVNDSGELTGIIDWDRLAVAPAEYEIDMMWRFWNAPWDFPMGELKHRFTEPLPVELISPIIAVSSQGLDYNSLNARLSLLELPFSIRKTVDHYGDDSSMEQLETVLSGGWADQLIG